MASQKKIQVTLVTGFLGAGKTTFVNRLLQQNRGAKIVVIENEFGDVSIDSTLIANYNQGSVLEMNNGCICCSLFNEFSLALQELVKQSSHFDQLVIETTGVADPEPIIQPFFRDIDLLNMFEFRGTVCLIDAQNFQEETGQFEQMKQIILADLLLLNKVSDADSKKLQYIRRKVKALNGTATIIETDFAQSDLLELNLLHEQVQDDLVKKLSRPLFMEGESKAFQSFSIRFDIRVDEKRFREWFAYFVSLYRKNIFRIKGLVVFDGNPDYSIVQSMGGTFSIVAGGMINPLGKAESVLVFIGNEIAKFEIEKMFDEFLFPEINQD